MPPQVKDRDHPERVSRKTFIGRWKRFVAQQSGRSSDDESDRSNTESNSSQDTEQSLGEDDTSEESESVATDLSTAEFCSTGPQDNFLKDKCIGVVDVHVQNLVPPHPSRAVRLLDYDHVATLTESFSSQAIGQLVILSGMITATQDPKQLRKEGGGEVEVLGGNHTRQALQSLLEKDLLESPCVKVTLYRPLSTQAALTVGYQHNVVLHEKQKPVNFMEKVRLMRQCRPGQAMSKSQTVAWKDMLVNIFRAKDRRHLMAAYSQHLQMAQMPETIWKKVLITTDAMSINEKFFRPLMKIKDEAAISRCLDILDASGVDAYKKHVKSITAKTAETGRKVDNKATNSEDAHSVTAEKTSELQKLKEKHAMLQEKYELLLSEHDKITDELQQRKESCSCRRNQTKRKASEDEVKKGEDVMAKWHDENGDRWLQAKVISVSNKGVKVQYAEDKCFSTVPVSWIRR